MGGFKTTLITCQQCGRRIMVRAADVERGFITCSHTGCGAVNVLETTGYYDEGFLHDLDSLGQLTYQGDSIRTYSLQFGSNVIGIASSCTVQVERSVHNGRCFISRRHCTLTVTFDKWTGLLRYQLQDGAVDPATQVMHHSKNGIQLNGVTLAKAELIDVPDGGIITLGGLDQFRLNHVSISPDALITHKVETVFNPDQTQ
ncbi:FHA domain-containing protein [Spirosoma sp. BT702]|uniref:FHA domain-containing protein n=1 Tax=Spirosoma profusum TaxID=2771354 RepID=A0A926XTL4_9BACT|nr:FHA domain-containing protein [Spirosoma profusum]MBD2699295.1 FHA domain-containing protein [Spirosoma profusum]